MGEDAGVWRPLRENATCGMILNDSGAVRHSHPAVGKWTFGVNVVICLIVLVDADLASVVAAGGR